MSKRELLYCMSTRGNVCTVVRMKDGSEVKGRFKWSVDLTEKEALTTVLHHFTCDELKNIQTLELDPVDKTLAWLQKKTKYDFSKIELCPSAKS